MKTSITLALDGPILASPNLSPCEASNSALSRNAQLFQRPRSFWRGSHIQPTTSIFTKKKWNAYPTRSAGSPDRRIYKCCNFLNILRRDSTERSGDFFGALEFEALRIPKGFSATKMVLKLRSISFLGTSNKHSKCQGSIDSEIAIFDTQPVTQLIIQLITARGKSCTHMPLLARKYMVKQHQLM